MYALAYLFLWSVNKNIWKFLPLINNIAYVTEELEFIYRA